MRCEGWTRKGGAFTLGLPTWHQCEEEGTVNIEFKQGNEEITTLPMCNKCWEKGIEKEEIKILSVEPITDNQKIHSTEKSE